MHLDTGDEVLIAPLSTYSMHLFCANTPQIEPSAAMIGKKLTLVNFIISSACPTVESSRRVPVG